MKILFFAILSLAISAPAMADEFGSMFRDQAPSALESASNQDDAEIADIEPAAGEKEDGDQKRRQKTEEELREKELEEKLGTSVESTIQDRGDGQIKEHDSIGDGNVRLFRQRNEDERINDDNDTIGIELKLLEFK